MCVLIDVVLRGLLYTSTVSSLPKPVFDTNGARSEMLFPLRLSTVRFVKFDSADISEMLLLLRPSVCKFVKEDCADTSEMLLAPRYSSVRLDRLPNWEGIVPLSWLVLRFSNSRLARLPSWEGISPDSALLSRSSAVWQKKPYVLY